jgi:hypothetical protein
MGRFSTMLALLPGDAPAARNARLAQAFTTYL